MEWSFLLKMIAWGMLGVQQADRKASRKLCNSYVIYQK